MMQELLSEFLQVPREAFFTALEKKVLQDRGRQVQEIKETVSIEGSTMSSVMQPKVLMCLEYF